MKKSLVAVAVILCFYLFGVFCYDLASPNASSVLANEILPDSRLYELKIFGEKLHLNFASAENDKERLRAIFLNRRLAEAESMLQDGKAGQAQQMVNKFASGAEGLMAELKKQDYLRIDPQRATDIEKTLIEQITVQKKLMAGISSTSPLFPIKDRLLALELNLTDTPEEKRLVQERQAKEQLIEAPASTKVVQKNSATDWQIIKQELSAWQQEVKNYSLANIDKITQGLSWSKHKYQELINNVKK